MVISVDVSQSLHVAHQSLFPLQRELTGQPDLSQVTYLELSINTSENSLGNFGKSPRH